MYTYVEVSRWRKLSGNVWWICLQVKTTGAMIWLKIGLRGNSFYRDDVGGCMGALMTIYRPGLSVTYKTILIIWITKPLLHLHYGMQAI